MAACKISLVQITSPFSGLGDFLHDHLGTVMVGTCFSEKIRTCSGPHGRNSYFCHTHFAPDGLDTAGYMLEAIMIKNDTCHH